MPRFGLALLFAALAVGTAGCGSSDDGTTGVAGAPSPVVTADGSPAEPTSTATPAATGATPASTPTATTTSGGVSTDSAGDGTPASGGASVDGASGSAPACKSGVLAALLDFAGGGAAGSTTGNLVLRNTSSTACTLYGYPGVSFVDASGHQVGAPATRSGGTARTVTVGPSDSAFAQVKIVDAENFAPATCGLTQATGLRVYPPGEKAALYVQRDFEACSKTGVQVITIGPMSTD